MSSETTVQQHQAAAWRMVQVPVRGLLACLGLAWASAFIVVGTVWHLQLYGDGAIFSFAVAVGKSWAVHWHNIVGRSSVLLLCMWPAEGIAQWMQNPQAGIAAYGFLFFSAPAFGLAITYVCDHSERRAFFTTACVSTACLCPLVFGFPTEMWIGHAAFWPALTLAHRTPRGRFGFVGLLLAMIVLVFTHEGAVALAFVLVATTLVRRSIAILVRGFGALAIALALLALAHAIAPPDDYFAPVFAHARQHFFDLVIFTSGAVAMPAVLLAVYATLLLTLRHLGSGIAIGSAFAIVLAGLAVYGLSFTPALHADNRYCLRTALVVLTPFFAMVAALLGTRVSDQSRLPARLTAVLGRMLDRPMVVQSAIGAIALIMLVHVVETVRFVDAWTGYSNDVRSLASSTISDPALGDPRFVSSARVERPQKALAWSSTTPYASVLLAPALSPSRLVVDPTAGYFWLSCELSRAIETERPQALPAAGLDLIRTYSCLHRQEGKPALDEPTRMSRPR